MKWNAFTLVLALFAAAPPGAAETAAPSLAPLFAASFPTLEGKPLPFESLRGTPLVVNFWARWCGPCREELPRLDQADRDYRKHGLQVIGVAVDDRAEAVQEFATAYEVHFRQVLGKDKAIELMQALGNPAAALPYTLVIDRHGNLVGRKLGAIQQAELDAYVKTALE